MGYIKSGENGRSGSTTWVPEVDRMRPEPAGRAKRPAGSSRWSGVKRRDPKVPLDLKIRYRGGAESWWLVEARGCRAVFPGHMCIEDVMREINEGERRYW